MKLLYIVNVDWFFVSHRLPIALRGIEDGHEVHIACGITDKKNYLESLGIKVHPISLTRSGIGIFNEFKTLAKLWKIVSKINPDVCHTITIKGVIYGGLITRLLKTNTRVASISGLGYIFIDESIKARVLRLIVKRLYKLALSTDTRVIFQNKSDEFFFVNSDIIKQRQCTLIRGSGVNLNLMHYIPEPTSQKTVMFLARLLKDKGLIEFCNAAKVVKRNIKVRFVLVGDLDPDNPNSISEEELATYVDRGIVQHWGYSKNVESVIPQSHIMVLPSYREGLPKSLLEAAACGRAVITTDVPGCRDAIAPNETGLLVEVKNIEKLAQAIIYLLENDSLRNQFGQAGRKLAERYFNIDDVVNIHMEIYKGDK